MHRERADVRAEKIIAEDLARLGWSPEELAARRKSDPAKLAMAARLRQETTLTIKAIAARLHLGTSKSANSRLHGWMRSHPVAGPQLAAHDTIAKTAVWQNLWVKMALSSSGRASPLRVATGGDASWRLEARRRRSPTCC